MVLTFARSAAAAVPSGFAEESFTGSELTPATGAVWAPDGSGRLFVITKNGAIRVVRTEGGRPVTNPDGSLAVSTFATEPSVYTNSECGLLGITFDPNYVVNRYVYVFVTVSASEQRIVRYTDVDGGPGAPGTSVDRTVLIAGLPTAGQTHDGRGLAIGGDGKLYFSIGDLGNGTGIDADLADLASKVGRANLDGTPANDNPFYDGVGPNNEYIWARGLRNPFGLFRQPSTGKLWTTVAGSRYEQVFLLERGVHAGFDDYENNQPLPDYIPPKIAYRTNDVDTRNITSIVRAGGTLTVTTVAAHGFRVGQGIALSGFASNPSFNGDIYVASVPSPTSFTAVQPGGDASLGAGGQATTKFLGGAITRGTFYDATAFPSDYRGNLFFGDSNSGTIVRAALSSTNEVQRVDEWGTGFAVNVQVATGPDGALYTLGSTGGTLRRVASTSTTPRLVVANVTPHVPEGGRAAFTVSLATAPAANVSVTVARSGGDADIDVLSGGTLTFTPTDWRTPRPVILAAAHDADDIPDVTTFDVSALGFTTEKVTATSIERSGPQLVLSALELHVAEGGEATMTVAWSGMLPATTTVTIRRTSGDADLTVSPATLTFTRQNATTPQTVTFAAADDADGVAGTADFAIATALDSRVVVVTEDDDEAPPPDAGAEAGSDDAGTSDAGTSDAGGKDAAGPPVDEPDPQSPPTAAGDDDPSASAEPESDDGCSCNVPGHTAASGALWMLPALLLWRRRRK